jgi:hypothetical protein
VDEMTDPTATRPFRPEQEDQFRLTADLLRALTDDQLEELTRQRTMWLVDRMESVKAFGGEEAVRAIWHDPVDRVQIAFSDQVVEEINHRRGAIWHAESDMMGGHCVFVGAGNVDPHKFYAYCFPYDDVCWDGPDRDTIGEALEDGRGHHPGYEPQLHRWLEGG